MLVTVLVEGDSQGSVTPAVTGLKPVRHLYMLCHTCTHEETHMKKECHWVRLRQQFPGGALHVQAYVQSPTIHKKRKLFGVVGDVAPWYQYIHST